MKIGIIGLPQVGKKTLFELLTGDRIASETYSKSEDVKLGLAKIRDERLDKLAALYQPERKIPATIDIVLLPKLDKETLESGQFLKSLETCDALCHIVRVFEDDAVFHIDGSVDPLRDVDNVYTELILSDLILVEKRLERISKELKHKPSVNQSQEEDILKRMKELLDKNIPLIKFSLDEQQKKIMSTYQFLTRKPMIISLNVNENALSDSKLVNEISEKYKDYGVSAMQISAKIEAELLSLDPSEQEAFLRDLNISESALNKLSRLCYEILGLISFFTVGKDEVRAWITKKGSSAPEASGSIHSDLQRGFIRAEIMKSSDLIDLGGEAKVRESGKLLLKGKEYIVEDGDIMHVRFSV